MLLELAVFHRKSVEIARRCGLSRIELCQNYSAGGLSPDTDFFSESRKIFKASLFVMIRPRPGNFEYDAGEVHWMESAIKKFDAAGADGFVLGCLKGNAIDAESLEKLVAAAGKKPVTFHRAIDAAADYDLAIEQLIACGCSRMLTSGKEKSALEGAELIARSIQKLGSRIGFLAGGGIRSGTAECLLAIQGLKELHSAAILKDGEIADENEVMKLLESINRVQPF